MQCNIDAKGKAVRLLSGLVVAALGIILVVLWALKAIPGSWALVGAFLIALGGFQIFEARAGWCVMRAMGFKTKI